MPPPLLVKLLRMHLLPPLTLPVLLPMPVPLLPTPVRLLPTLPLLLQLRVQLLHRLNHRSSNHCRTTGRRNVARCVCRPTLAGYFVQAVPESRYRLPARIL